MSFVLYSKYWGQESKGGRVGRVGGVVVWVVGVVWEEALGIQVNI